MIEIIFDNQNSVYQHYQLAKIVIDVKVKMANTSNLSGDAILTRMQAAQDIDSDLDQTCGTVTKKTIDAHCRVIGAPHPFIFFPLLTIIAACTGVKANIRVNDEWNEPLILWTIVAARKGEKKTPACKRLPKPINQLQTGLNLKYGICYPRVIISSRRI